MRDPALQFVSSLYRANLNNSDKILLFCVTCWDLLGRLEDKFEIEYLRLDSENHQFNLEKVAIHCGTKLTEAYKNTPIGSYFKEPIGYELWDQHKTPAIQAALKPYREKYGY